MRGLRAALRVLRRHPGFTAAAIATVALGSGASTAVFSTVNGVLLQSLPYPNGARVVHVTQPALKNHGADARFSIPELADYRSNTTTLTDLAEYHSMPFQIYGRGDPIRAQTGVVSAHFFDLLGVRPAQGRLFRAGEDAIGAHPVVVLSHRFWVDRLGADPTVVGATFTMNDKIHEIVGILPPLPPFPDDNDIWMPAGACPFRSSPATMNNRAARLLLVFGALRDGATLAQTETELTALQRRYQRDYSAVYQPANPLAIGVVALKTELTTEARPILWTLLATSLFLLLVASANFANLTLARQLRRSDEFALRTALGAGGGQLFRQLALESLCVTIPGTLIGTAMAYGSLGVLRTLAARITPRAGEITIDLPVLGFAVGSCLLVGLAAAVAPFLRLRATTLRAGSIASAVRGLGSSRIQDGLIAVQLGVAVVMLVGAGLLTKSALELERVDRLPNPDKVVSARVDLNWSRYRTNTQVWQFTERLLDRLAASPGVGAATVAASFPLNGDQPFRVPLQVSRIDQSTPTETRADLVAVGPGYFGIVGIPLLRGRAFTPSDRDTIRPPVIVSQTFARLSWPNGDPIGQRVSPDSGRTWLEVVGVATDIRQHDLTADPTNLVYYPFLGAPTTDFRILARIDGGLAGFNRVVTRTVSELDPKQPVGEFQTLEDVRDAELSQPRLTAVLLVGFAAIAVVLTGTGIAGVVATSISRRRKEIAVQKALGAPTTRVARHLLRPIIAMAMVGLVVGIGAATGLSHLIAGLLYRVAPTDLSVLGAAAVGITLVAFAAAVWPLRVVLKLEPSSVLRGD